MWGGLGGCGRGVDWMRNEGVGVDSLGKRVPVFKPDPRTWGEIGSYGGPNRTITGERKRTIQTQISERHRLDPEGEPYCLDCGAAWKLHPGASNLLPNANR